MDNKMQTEAFPKKFWSVMRVFFFMIRKGVSKKKLLPHLTFMLKRSKMVGKSIGNVMFHHQSTAAVTADLFSLYKATKAEQREYEFSCTKTSTHQKFLFKKEQHQAHYEAQYETIEEDFMNMMGLNDDVVASSSPVLPGLLGFKPIRVTDSPFPVFSGRIAEGECHVDEAADEFITRFYSQLRRQSLTDV